MGGNMEEEKQAWRFMDEEKQAWKFTAFVRQIRVEPLANGIDVPLLANPDTTVHMIRPEWRIERGGLLTPRCGQRGPRRTLFEALMQAIRQH